MTYKVPTDKFTHAGVSRKDGKVKIRFAAETKQLERLAKMGHTDIMLLEHPGGPATKPELIAWLKTTDLYQNSEENRAAIDQRDQLYTPKVAVRVRKSKREQPSIDAIRDRISVSAETVVSEEQNETGWGQKWPHNFYMSTKSTSKPVRICGVDYPVILKTPAEMPHHWGEYHEALQEIWIRNDCTADNKSNTILHEILHAMSDVYGIDLKERQVFILANTLIGVCRDNPEYAQMFFGKK